MSKELVQFLSDANRILLFTGAGISTRSGISDYRGPQGVWQRRQPVYYQDFLSSESARIEYWDYKLEGWESFRTASPNEVHEAAVDLERSNKIAAVVTQNIDGLHALAGTSTSQLIELHGTNREVECQTCHERSNPAPHFEAFAKTRKPPMCHCGGLLKPATISFGQALLPADLERATAAAAEADLAIALGTTLSVYPAAGITLEAARRGVPYIIINQGATDHDSDPHVSLRLGGDVNEIFPTAVRAALLS